MTASRLARARSVLADTRPLKVPAFRRLWLADIVTVIGAQLTIVSVPAQMNRAGFVLLHPIVGVDAGGASIHQPEFAAAAAGESADTAVVEGAIMLARTVVALATDAGERDRVIELQHRRAA